MKQRRRKKHQEPPKEPETPAEWQTAVDTAAFMRAVHDCYLYGLLTGPAVNLRRCDELLERGAALGYRPRPLRAIAEEMARG